MSKSNRPPGRDAPAIGPTGEFPGGRLGKGDAGEIQVAIGHAHGRVVIGFGPEMGWLGMSPAEARGLAATLIKQAAAIDGRPFVLKL